MNQTAVEAHGLTGEALLATVVYAVIGIALMLIAVMTVNKIFNLSIHRELVQENNTAFGVLLGCMSIAISIVVAATIVG